MELYIEEIMGLCGSQFDKYQDPDEARGWCLIATEDLGRLVGWDGVEAVYTNHHNDPSGRYIQYHQHSDHYALYVVEDELVLDFTMRQFDSVSPFPFIGTVEQWKIKLETAWEYRNLEIVHKVICESCDGLGCVCCWECGERTDYCFCE